MVAGSTHSLQTSRKTERSFVFFFLERAIFFLYYICKEETIRRSESESSEKMSLVVLDDPDAADNSAQGSKNA